MDRLQIVSGTNPPAPAYLSKKEQDGIGQKLLTLVRSTENEDDDERKSDQQRQILQMLRYLTATVSRCGLLQGNTAAADGMLEKMGSLQNKSDQSRKKRGRESNSLSGLDGGNQVPSGESTGVQDPKYVLAALLRILQSGALTSPLQKMCRAAANILLASSEHVKANIHVSACSMAEFEILAEHGKVLLGALVDCMQQIIDTNGLGVASAMPSSSAAVTLIGCLKAASSLIALFGTKLSRSSALLKKVRTVSWELVFLSNVQVQRSAAGLLATLPLAGGTDKKTPSDFWNAAISESIGMLSRLLEEAAPIRSGGRGKGTQSVETISSSMEAALQSWLVTLRKESSQQRRAAIFRTYMQGLVCLSVSLLQRDSCKEMEYSFSGAKLDMHRILDLLENLLSFPLLAESLYSRTKKKLRDELIEGGIFNPTTIAGAVANQIKTFGHQLLDCAVLSVGGDALLPYASRFTRISYASLVTSCSGPVTSVVDQANAIPVGGKKRRWLHESITLRHFSVRSFRIVISAFGYDHSDGPNASRSSAHTQGSFNDVERGARLVAGCLVEQIASVKQCTPSADWGSIKERSDLIVVAAHCLISILQSCGRYMDSATRFLVDSVTRESLVLISMPNYHAVTWSAVTAVVLDLGAICQLTPWPDGTSSLLHSVLSDVAQLYISGCDIACVSSAQKALQICNMCNVSRAPPLLFVTKSANPTLHSNNSEALHTGTFLAAAETSRETAARTKKETEERTEKSKAEAKADLQSTSKRSKSTSQQNTRTTDTKDSNSEKTLEVTMPTLKTAPAKGEGQSKKSPSKFISANTNASKPIETVSATHTKAGKKTKKNGKDGNVDAKLSMKETEVVAEPEEADIDHEDSNNPNQDMHQDEVQSDDKESKSDVDDDDDEMPEIFDGMADSDED